MKIFNNPVNKFTYKKIMKKYTEEILREHIDGIEELKIFCNQLSNIENDFLVLKIIVLSFSDPKILIFARGLTDDQIDFGRYEKWKKHNDANPMDASSFQYMKLKYGESWESRIRKSSHRNNPYDIQYVMKRDNCDYHDAVSVVEALKLRTKPNVEKMGVEKYKFTTRRHKNYLDYWVKFHNGDIILANDAWLSYKKKSSPRSKEHYINKGYSEEEAISLVQHIQINMSGVNQQYYKNKKIPQHEIDQIINEINTRKDSSSKASLVKRNPHHSEDEIDKIYKLRCMNKSSYYKKHGVMLSEAEYYDRVQYYKIVDAITRQNIKYMIPCDGTRGKRKGDYHIDHIFSKVEGYNNGIDPKIIGSVINLRWLDSTSNCSKRGDCDITVEDLLRRYKEHRDENNED